MTCSRSRCTGSTEKKGTLLPRKSEGGENPPQTHKPGSRAAPHLSCVLPLTERGPPRGSDLAPKNVYLQIPGTYRIPCGKQYLTVLWKETAKLTGFSPWFLRVIDELFFPSSQYFLCLQPCRLLKRQWGNFIMFYTFHLQWWSVSFSMGPYSMLIPQVSYTA